MSSRRSTTARRPAVGRLYGALGYDLMFQFEPINPSLSRKEQQQVTVDAGPYLSPTRSWWWTRGSSRPGRYSTTLRGAWPAKKRRCLPWIWLGRQGGRLPSSHEEGTPVQDRDVEPGATRYTPSPKDRSRSSHVGICLKWSYRSSGPSLQKRSVRRLPTLRKRNPSPYGFLMNLRGEDDSSVPWIAWL